MIAIKKSDPRRESSLINSAKTFLQILKNAKRIVFFMRLNSGKAFVDDGHGNTRRIELCPNGTADLLVVLLTGEVLWLEGKTDSGIQSDDQIAFMEMITQTPNHYYVIFRTVSKMIEVLKGFAVKMES